TDGILTAFLTPTAVAIPSEFCPSESVGKSSEILTRFRRLSFFRRDISDDCFRRKFVGNSLFRRHSDEFGRQNSLVFL
ncbi:hypothetical protein N665_0579s0004, partial [Sinapis alba]